MRTEPGGLSWPLFCSDCGRSVATSAAAPGGASGPVPQGRGTERGCLHPGATADELHLLDHPALDIRMIRDHLVIDDLAVVSAHPNLERRETAMAELVLA